jgi:hypothetical protein
MQINWKQKQIALCLVVLILLCSCGSVSPVINQYEKAGTLKKGNFELMGNITGYSAAGGGGSESLNNNLGFRVGYGISDKVNFKFRYEQLKPANNFEYENSNSVNYFSFIPKFALIPDQLALLVPFSHYSAKAEKNERGELIEEAYSFSSITPQLIYTFTNAKNTMDLSPGLRADVLFAGDGGGVLLGATLGAGFSTNLNRWAIRPEVGALSIGAGAFFVSYGVGLQLVLSKRSATHKR